VKIMAVVDRIEASQAVLLFGENEARVLVPLSCLPYVSEGSVLYFTIEVDKSGEEKRRIEAEFLMQKLKGSRAEK